MSFLRRTNFPNGWSGLPPWVTLAGCPGLCRLLQPLGHLSANKRIKIIRKPTISLLIGSPLVTLVHLRLKRAYIERSATYQQTNVLKWLESQQSACWLVNLGSLLEEFIQRIQLMEAEAGELLLEIPVEELVRLLEVLVVHLHLLHLQLSVLQDGQGPEVLVLHAGQLGL